MSQIDIKSKEFTNIQDALTKNLIKVDLPGTSEYYMGDHPPYPIMLNMYLSWLRENNIVYQHYNTTSGKNDFVYLESQEDATLFKLRFGI